MKLLTVLLGSQLSYSVSSVNKTGHGSIRVRAKPNNDIQNEPILHVVNRNKQRTRPTRRQAAKNVNKNSASDSKESKNSRISSRLKTVNEVTALFSNTFYNIFNFQENGPVPANKISFQTKSHSEKIAASNIQNEEIQYNELRDSLGKRDSDLAQDYAAAYDDYVENVIGSDLEDAVNGDGSSEYYYSDDYIDYEFDSISQIEDTTTHGTLKNENRTTSNTTIVDPEKAQMWRSPEPVVLFSIALTLFGVLQIFLSRSENKSGSLSCLPDDEMEDGDFIEIESEKEVDVQIEITHDRLVEDQPKNSLSGNNVKNENSINFAVKNDQCRRNAKSYPISLDRIDEEILSM